MAQKREIIPVAADVGPATYPVIDLPLSAFDRPNSKVNVNTSSGLVTVEVGYSRLYCVGSAEALIAMNLIDQSWLPGQPGINKTCCFVQFDGDQRFLVKGSRISRPGTLGLDIEKAGKHYRVYIDMTEAQKTEQKARKEEKEQAEQKAKTQPFYPKTPEQAQRWLQSCAESYTGALRIMQEDTGCCFTDESLHFINAAHEVLLKAYAGARMVRAVPRYQREGNVIHWPGRS